MTRLEPWGGSGWTTSSGGGLWPDHNPMQAQGQLVAAPEDYLWSSARYYLKGEPPVIPVKDVRALLI